MLAIATCMTQKQFLNMSELLAKRNNKRAFIVDTTLSAVIPELHLERRERALSGIHWCCRLAENGIGSRLALHLAGMTAERVLIKLLFQNQSISCPSPSSGCDSGMTVDRKVSATGNSQLFVLRTSNPTFHAMISELTQRFICCS